MKRLHLQAISLWLSLAFVMVACGQTDDARRTSDPCKNITCEANATCEPATKTCECNAGYVDVDGTCEVAESLACTDVAPANATSTVVEVTEAQNCDWQCNAGYLEVDGICEAEETILCTDVAPQNATSIVAEVDEAQDCPWECNAGYMEVEGACEVDGEAILCTDVAPDNATSNIVEVDEPQDCQWECNVDYIEVEGACEVDEALFCDDVAPDNATSNIVEVDEPQDCDWACDVGYGLVDGECLNSRMAPCVDEAPEHATSIQTDVEITWTGTQWTEPAACDWDCSENFHPEGQLCVANVTIDWCNLESPTWIQTTIGSTFAAYRGRIYSANGTQGPGRLSGITGMLCHTYEQVIPTDPSNLTCFEASYLGDRDGLVGNDLANDEYVAAATYDLIGFARYFYAFSGDGGESWTFCDLDGVMGETPNAGRTTASGAYNWRFDNWDDEIPDGYTAGSAVGVEKELHGSDHGPHSVRLTRNVANNTNTEFSTVLNPVSGGHDYVIDMWILDTGPDARGMLNYQWYGADGVALANATFTNQYSSAATEWQLISREVTAPADAHFLRVATRVYSQGEPTGGSILLDAILISPVE